MDKLNVLLLESVDQAAKERLAKESFIHVETKDEALNPEELKEILHSIHVIGVRSRTALTQEILQMAPNLLAIGCFCVGVNNVDLLASTRLGIPVFNAPHASTRSVAELTIGMVIILMRDIIRKDRLMHCGGWPKTAVDSHEVRGKVLGIVGYGHIGSQVSVMAEALGMKVIYYDIQKKLSLGNAESVGSLEDLLKRSDVVTLHVPETEQTNQMMNGEKLKLMKKGACLINLSRGSVVDLTALNPLLKSRQIKGAALDVFPKEPKTAESSFDTSLKDQESVILTPHIGGATIEAQRNIGLEVAEKLILYLDRGSTEGAVNFPHVTLPRHEETHRVIHIHENVPGVLQQINKVIGDKKINVHSQYLLTNSEIGYVVMDVEKRVSKELEEALVSVEHTIRCRVLY